MIGCYGCSVNTLAIRVQYNLSSPVELYEHVETGLLTLLMVSIDMYVTGFRMLGDWPMRVGDLVCL